MSETAILEPTPASHPNQTPLALTRDTQRRFLELLSQTGNIYKVCTVLDISPTSPYNWSKSDEFRKKFDAAKAMGEKVLMAEYEDIVDRRINNYYFDPGSTNLTMFRMKRIDPAYRDNAVVNVNAVGPVAIQFNLNTSMQTMKADEQAE